MKLKNFFLKLFTQGHFCACNHKRSFEYYLRDEFLVNTQNYPKEYHSLFREKYKRAERAYHEAIKAEKLKGAI